MARKGQSASRSVAVHLNLEKRSVRLCPCILTFSCVIQSKKIQGQQRSKDQMERGASYNEIPAYIHKPCLTFNPLTILFLRN
jgi:hypothetical protein